MGRAQVKHGDCTLEWNKNRACRIHVHLFSEIFRKDIPGRMWINSGNGYSTSRVLLTENKLDKEGSVTSQKVVFSSKSLLTFENRAY